ncbi:hypothetical protein DQM68_01405 [Leptospira mayottensis]|uniref:Uncharacterized protein n=2 Tax=Leptospira mayottensis TaxID=1137606 RepID=A0AA87ML37_9LEPT|nr:hypothetical protein DQM68_01405 [Leptospira mayottensis]AXR63354.1 hypothetical protein DQM28_03035 [Leptospira mayottensis]AZQ01115.1 hypothetical protein LEP1GSC190_02575 [Leptospira mayottensis 200901116]EKR98193.1 hypothetical protein LEP1GSC125_0983 [Leptospira mayottensis 200901122]TGN10324.1 hypothetical protein EHR03_07315 [Leptospira mayottensis]
MQESRKDNRKIEFFSDLFREPAEPVSKFRERPVDFGFEFHFNGKRNFLSYVSVKQKSELAKNRICEN